MIITNIIPIRKNRKDVQKAIKKYIIDLSILYRIFHYSSKSDLNLQIVDYFNWAIFRKWEREDSRSYNLIKDAILSEFDVFETGDNFFY